jgi:hypothetical protein
MLYVNSGDLFENSETGISFFVIQVDYTTGVKYRTTMYHAGHWVTFAQFEEIIRRYVDPTFEIVIPESKRPKVGEIYRHYSGDYKPWKIVGFSDDIIFVKPLNEAFEEIDEEIHEMKKENFSYRKYQKMLTVKINIKARFVL